MADDLFFATISDLSREIASRKLSPVELTRSYLDRAETLNGKTNLVVTLTRDHAMKRAEEAEKEIRAGKIRGPLHGIPYGVKDLADTAGIRTTWGSIIFKDRVPNRDAAVVQKLNDAGAVMVAKLHMAEFAGGGQKSNLLDHARNPWKLDRTTSGSSSGSGGATAAGMVVFAIGSETGGSIVSPAASCGVAGMRPTYGRVSRYGCMTLAWSLDKIGPLARSARDIGTVLEAIAGHDPRDPTSGTATFKFRPDPGRVRGRKIGVHRSEFDLRSEHNRAVFARSLDVLKQAGFELEDFQLPVRPYGECYNMHTYSEARTFFKALYDDKRIAGMYNNMRRDDWMATSMLPASDYVAASRIRQFIKAEGDLLLSKYAAVVAPTSGTGAGRITEQTLATVRTGPPRVNIMAQLIGVPGLSVPCGFDEDGMPLGLHITAKAWDEQAALDVAMTFQKETDWHKQRPTFRP